MSSNRDEVIIWFDTPPKVSKGAFNYLSRNWGARVYYVCNKDYPEYRKRVNWNDGDFGAAEFILLEGVKDKKAYIRTLFENHPNAVHILSGFNNGIEVLVRPFILSSKNHLVIFSERPVEVGTTIEKWLRLLFFRIKYGYYYKLYGKYVNLLLPLGIKGVNTFARFGWPMTKMMPFMYNPEGHLIEAASSVKRLKTDAIRFLYVGRFYYRTKGVDVLMKAVKYLKGRWLLDFVGGYGKKADEVKSWIDHTPNARFIGSWSYQDVAKNMRQYDVVIVPSKYDGWNLLVNEAINAGVGVIVSDQAVSDEVIRFGHAGKVFRSNHPKELAKAMQYVIDNPEVIEEWRNLAVKTSVLISPETVGEYLIQLLDYYVYGVGSRPSCPWLTSVD